MGSRVSGTVMVMVRVRITTGVRLGHDTKLQGVELCEDRVKKHTFGGGGCYRKHRLVFYLQHFL